MNTFIIFCILIGLVFCNENNEITCPKNGVEYFSNELPLIVLDYNDLKNNANLQQEISIAYGQEGLGILLVKNVPGLKLKRERLLKLSRQLGLMNENDKQSMVHEKSHYSVGWSHGKEKLSKNQPDYSKGSFYGNPIIDDPTNNNTYLIDNYPSFYYPNIWPEQLPLLREYFMDLGSLIYDVGNDIAKQMDNYASNIYNGYKKNTLTEVIGTNIPKARLLYYYSFNDMKSFTNITSSSSSSSENLYKNKPDSWCGWHNDHSALTGLALGMYFDEHGRVVSNVEDEVCGLYIKTRTNKIYRIHMDEEKASSYLAYQIGETSQILSGGSLLATPHSVHGTNTNKYPKISRASYAVFMQPTHEHHMRAPFDSNLEQIQLNRFLPDNVPTLSSRWNNDTYDTFGQFTKRTLSSYY